MTSVIPGPQVRASPAAARRDSISSQASNESSTGSLESAASTAASFSAVNDAFENSLEGMGNLSISIIKESWTTAISKKDSSDATPISSFVSKFFEKLYQLAPETSLVFANDTSLQGKCFSVVLTGILDTLSNPKKLSGNPRRCIEIQSTIGLTPQMFTAFVDAFVFTLKTRLGANFNSQVELAWRDSLKQMYELLSDTVNKSGFRSRYVPDWLIQKYKMHNMTLKHCWDRACTPDNGIKVLDSFLFHITKEFPSTSRLYETADHAKRKVIIWTAVNKILNALENLENLKKDLKPLYALHARLGVDRAMLEAFGVCLRSAMKDAHKAHGFAKDYTDAVDMTWQGCYRLVQLAMADGIEKASGDDDSASGAMKRSSSGKGSKNECNVM